MFVADKAQVVTVEIEPGVYGTQVKHTRAVVATYVFVLFCRMNRVLFNLKIPGKIYIEG